MNVLSEISVSYSQKINKELFIKSSMDSYECLNQFWQDISLNESFNVMFLNKSNQVKGIYRLSKGGLDCVIVDVRLLFSIALKTLSTAIVVAHNHPSGSLTPSKADDQVTEKIKKAAKFLDIKLLDHLILTPSNGYFSYADDSRL